MSEPTLKNSPARLRCNNLENPLGIHDTSPQLSWWLNDDRPAEIQTAYHILVASAQSELDQDEADLWNSGKVESDQTSYIRYSGRTLGSRMRAFWKVRTFDSDGLASAWSDTGYFELGLLKVEDWSANWISSTLMGDKQTAVAVPALRREFEIEKKVVSARLYVSALGVYDFELNGLRAIDQELAPGWTDYSKRVRYQVYDVTHLLDTGENAMGALLGDGWYCGKVGMGDRQQYGDRPELIAQLEIYLDDGSIQTVSSDARWQWRASEIIYSDMQKGESVDQRQMLGAWSEAYYSTESWQAVSVSAPRSLTLDPAIGAGVRVVEVLEAETNPRVSILDQGKRRFIYDLGQNMVGRIRLRLHAQPGTLVRIRYAERLDDQGLLYCENLRAAQATDYLTCAGGDCIFEPRFTFHGFQYVEITGQLSADALIEVKGVVLSSILHSSGEFECDHPLVNQLQSNICRSQLGNFLDIPLDCPQRDERLGWTGDAHVFARTAAFNADLAAFFRKWMQDLEDAQAPDGSVPCVAPMPPGVILPKEGGPGWSDAIILCPWTMYRCYGDRGILEKHYAAMKAFMNNLESRYPDCIRASQTNFEKDEWLGFGDWLATESNASMDSRSGTTPKDLIGTAFYCYSAKLLARIAGITGNLHDLDYYGALAQKIQKAFQARFVSAEGRLISDTQTAYVLALHFGLLNVEQSRLAVSQLVSDIQARNYHLSTGFLGTPYLLHVLTRYGELGVAYRLLLQTSAPGWLYPVTQGATSIWERWDGWSEEKGFQSSGMNSFNHYALGAVGEWLYSTLGGLELAPDLVPVRNAYRHALIQPRPPLGDQFPGSPPIRWVSVALDTVHGRIESEWEIINSVFTLKIKIPSNCSATVVLPNRKQHEVAAGRHQFEVNLTDGALGSDASGRYQAAG